MDASLEPEISDLLKRFVDESPRARTPTLAFVRRVAASLPAGAKVIDVGAGNAPFRELFAHASYLTCDWENSIYRPAIPPDIRAPAHQLPLEDESVDAILSTDVLEHVAEPTSVLEDFHRVLKPGGEVWITVPFIWYLHEQPYDYYRYTSHGLRFLLEHAGFVDIEITPLSDAFSTLAQLTRDLGWMMGRCGDDFDGQRDLIGRTMQPVAELIGSFSSFDTQWILPIEYSVIARRPDVSTKKDHHMADDATSNAITRTGTVALLPGSITPYDLQDEIEEAIERVRYHTMVTFSRLATNYQMATHCEDKRVLGAFVECGVWKGGSSGLMAIASLRHGTQPRDLHLFDSFQDMCQPDETVDGERAVREARDWASHTSPLTGALEPMTGFYAQMGGPGSAEECEDLILHQIGYPRANLHIHRGWFQETLEDCREEVGPIAILRLDCDYYASTRYCLDTLYDSVVPGGFVIINDYGWYKGCRQAVDQFIEERGITAFLNHVDECGRYLIKA